MTEISGWEGPAFHCCMDLSMSMSSSLRPSTLSSMKARNFEMIILENVNLLRNRVVRDRPSISSSYQGEDASLLAIDGGTLLHAALISLGCLLISNVNPRTYPCLYFEGASSIFSNSFLSHARDCGTMARPGWS
jgi:hypothetical protein